MLGLFAVFVARLSGSAGGARARKVHGRTVIVGAKKPRLSTSLRAAYWRTVYAVVEACWLNMTQVERDVWLRGCPCRGLSGRDYFSRVNIPQVGRYRHWFRTRPVHPHFAAHHEELAGGEVLPGQVAGWMSDSAPEPLGPGFYEWNTIASRINSRLIVYPVHASISYVESGSCMTLSLLNSYRAAVDALTPTYRRVTVQYTGLAWTPADVKQAAFGATGWRGGGGFPEGGIRWADYNELDEVLKLMLWSSAGGPSSFAAAKLYGEQLGGPGIGWAAMWTAARAKYLIDAWDSYTGEPVAGRVGTRTYRGGTWLAAAEQWRTSDVVFEAGVYVHPIVSATVRVQQGDVAEYFEKVEFFEGPNFTGPSWILTWTGANESFVVGSPTAVAGGEVHVSMTSLPMDDGIDNGYEPTIIPPPPGYTMRGQMYVVKELLVKLNYVDVAP